MDLYQLYYENLHWVSSSCWRIFQVCPLSLSYWKTSRIKFGLFLDHWRFSRETPSIEPPFYFVTMPCGESVAMLIDGSPLCPLASSEPDVEAPGRWQSGPNLGNPETISFGNLRTFLQCCCFLGPPGMEDLGEELKFYWQLSGSLSTEAAAFGASSHGECPLTLLRMQDNDEPFKKGRGSCPHYSYSLATWVLKQRLNRSQVCQP